MLELGMNRFCKPLQSNKSPFVLAETAYSMFLGGYRDISIEGQKVVVVLGYTFDFLLGFATVFECTTKP